MLPSPPRECTLPGALHDPGQGVSVGLPSEMAEPRRTEQTISSTAGSPRSGIEADEIERAVIGAAHALFWPGDPRAALARPRRARARARPGPLEGAPSERARPRPCAGRRRRSPPARPTPPSCSTPRWPGSRSATRRSTPWSRPSPSARARCSTAAPTGPLHGVPVVIKDEWPLPWRAQRFGMAEMLNPTAPGESGPYRALRDAGAVIVGVGNMHEAGAEQHRQRLRLRPRPQSLEHRALPRRLLERPRRRGRRAPGGRRGRRRRDRLDPLPGRLLRPDRAEADLRPLGDGGPPHGGGDDDDRLRAALRRRRRLPPARLGAVRRGAGGGRAVRAADRRDRRRRRRRGRRPRGAARPARRRSRRCARRPAARSARSRCPTSTPRRWPR